SRLRRIFITPSEAHGLKSGNLSWETMDEGPLCAKACSGENGGCSQKCQKLPLPNASASLDILYLTMMLKKCKADGGPATFVYLLPDQIRGIDLSTGSQRVLVSDFSADMRGMDYDASEGIIFWSDWKDGTINSYTLNGNKRDILMTSSIRPLFLRWDWIARNIYYTDDLANIAACSRDGKYCDIVIPKVDININSFDLAPRSGVMFWSVWGTTHRRNTGVIERAELDGSHRVQIVKERLLMAPICTVDHIMEMIYWIDTKINVMECADFHGLKRRAVVSEGLYHPFSMAMFEDYVYWADWGTDSFIRCDKFGGRNCIVLHRGNVKSEVSMVVHKLNQPKGLNRCANHTCAQLCFPTRTSYACKCSTDYEKDHSGCKIVTTTPPPPPTPEPTCPEDYCKHGAKCIVSGGEYFCHCPSEFQGEKCELQTAAAQGAYDYSWIVGLVVAVFSFGTVVSIIILCRMNRERLIRARERVAVTFRNTGWIRSSGRLVMDTDDGGACDELVSGKKGSFKQTRFTNPLFAKKPRVFSDPESNDGDFKRWPSYDSGDSAFASESQTREGSQLCINETPLSGPKTTDRIIQFFKR
ncbi:low-density lipoprotein receptor-related protein 2, partial [Trichonephila inaurata madagascariensis]